jgi:hypothetical protein
MPAQKLAMTRPGARAAVFMHAAVPLGLPDYDADATTLVLERVRGFPGPTS